MPRYYSYVDTTVGLGSTTVDDMIIQGSEFGVVPSIDIVARNITATGAFIGTLGNSHNLFTDITVTGIATIGIVTGATYYGDGSNLTGLDVSGDIDIDNLVVSGISTFGIVNATSFSGSGANLTNVNATTLDSIDSGSFLRSDADDTYSGVITGNQLHLGGSQIIGGSSAKLQVNGFSRQGTIYLHDLTNGGATTIKNVNGVLSWDNNTIWHAGNDGSGSGLDADTLDGIQASGFLRSDSTTSSTSGNITISKALPKLILDSPGTGDIWTSQGAQITLGESGDGGSAALHLTYSGNGYGYIGMGALPSTGIPPYSAIRFHYNSNNIYFYSNPSIGGNTNWHAGNDGSGSGLDADTVDGIQASSFLRSDADDTLTGNLQINSHVINMDLNNINDNAIELTEVRDSTWSFRFVTNDVGNDNPSGFWVGSNGYPDMRLRRENSTVRALISSWETSYVSNGFNINGSTAWHAGNDGSGSGLDADTLDGQEGSYYRNASNINAGTFPDRFDVGTRYNIGLIDGSSAQSYDKLRVWNSSTYAIGMRSAMTYGWLNDYAMTFTMNNETDRGFIWRDSDDAQSDGAMSLTTNGNLMVKNAIGIAGNTSNYFMNGSWGFRHQTSSGYIEFGPANTTYGHIYTDRPSFYFNKQLLVNGSTVWNAGNDGSGSGLDADTVDGIQASSFLRSDAADTATGTLTVRDVKFQAGYTLQRSSHQSGHLEGGHNNIGSTSTKTSPIYTIGSSYNPGESTLGNMYGIGYTNSDASFISLTGASGWGMYVASDGDARIFLCGQNGTISATGDIVAYASDGRLKTNVKSISNPIEKIKKIRGVTFDWVDDITSEYDFHPTAKHETGVIAQEIQEVIPDAVITAPFNGNYTAKSGTDHNFLTVDKEKIVPLLIEAIKDQQTQIENQQKQIDELKSLVTLNINNIK